MPGDVARAAQLDELAQTEGPTENTYVARVSAKSKATAGGRVQLALDTSRLTLFDAETGRNLSTQSRST
jgi:multiple sugar transport system ATP-binding protein